MVILLFAGLILRCWQLQVVRSTAYDELARANHVLLVPETAARGLILDRDGRIVAENRPSFNLTLEGEHLGTLLSIGDLADLSEEEVELFRRIRELRNDRSAAAAARPA